MTWISTWPLHTRPQYAEHATEQAAAEHAKQLRATGHREAVYFWSTQSAHPSWRTKRKPSAEESA